MEYLLGSAHRYLIIFEEAVSHLWSSFFIMSVSPAPAMFEPGYLCSCAAGLMPFVSPCTTSPCLHIVDINC